MRVFKFFRNLSLGLKLNLVVFLVLGVLLAIIVLVLNNSMGSLINRTGQQRVEQEAEIMQSRFKEAERKVLADTKLLAGARGLIEAVANRAASSLGTTIAIGAASLAVLEPDASIGLLGSAPV